MLLRADGGLRAVWMRGEEFGIQRIDHLVGIVGQVDVVLLIDSLQFGMEATDHHVTEAVGLNLGPVVHLIRGDVLHIACHIVRREGVGALRANGSHEFVVLVGDVILRSQLTDGVDLMVGLTAFLGVGQQAVGLIALLYLVQIGCLGDRVAHAELIRTLEHQVLQIVCQSGGLCGVVLRTGAHGDIRLYARLFLVHAQIHLQSVVQGVDACLCQVALHLFILVL